MAKKKQKQGKSGKAVKAAEGAKLPKRIAGVKVPKHLRESGGKLMEAVSHPLVMDVAAAALMAAAAALRDGKKAGEAPVAGAKADAKRKPDIGPILALAAVEGVRKIAEARRSGGKGGGGKTDNSV